MRKLLLVLCMVAAPAMAVAEQLTTWLQPVAITDAQWPITLRTLEASALRDIYVRAPAVYADGDLLGGGAGDRANFARAVNDLAAAGFTPYAWITNGRRLEEQQADPNGYALPVNVELFVDFSNPAERSAQVSWMAMLLRQYPQLAGVSLDYIRAYEWAEPNSAYTEAVTDTVCAIRQATNAAGKQLSAAIFPAGGNQNIPAFAHVQQDPLRWIRNDCVDFVHTMQYRAADMDAMQAEVISWQRMEMQDRVIFTMGHYPGEDGAGGGQHPTNLAAMVPVIEGVTFGGWGIYTLGLPGSEAAEARLVAALNDVQAAATVDVTSPQPVARTATQSAAATSTDVCSGLKQAQLVRRWYTIRTRSNLSSFLATVG